MNEKIFAPALWSLNPNSNFEDDAVSGQLSFDGKSYLELDIPTGVLLDWPKIPTKDGYMQCHTVEGLHTDCVYGFSQTGEYYILRDVSSPGPSFAAPGFQKQSLSGASIFISRQRVEADPTAESISIKIPGLREWIGTVPFTVTSKLGGNRLTELTFNFDIDEVENVVLYENDEIEIYVSFSFLRDGGRTPSYEFSFKSDCKLNFRYKQPSLGFDRAMELHVFPVVDFLAFCMGFRYTISSIEFKTIEGVCAEYLAPLVGLAGVPTNAQLDRIPLSYKRIENKINEMISRWIGFDEYARNSSALVTSLMNDWKMPLDMLFLASAQAFEAASRSGANEREISDEELQEKLSAIKSSNMNSKLRKWVVYKLRDAKWKSANSLVGDLVGKLGDYATFVVPDVSKYLKDHRAHRDAYTHRRTIKDDQRLSNADLFTHTEATQMLAYGSIALYLGMEPEDLINAVKESRYRWNSIYRANLLYTIASNDDVL